MAISYVSQVYESNPYVLPVDLNLLQKVNQYKQENFYQNADRLSSELSQLTNSDIANPEQAQKLKGLVNNLTTQINNMGAMDFSDKNLVNRLSSYTTSVYSDPDVLNGISSTRRVRELQKNIEKLKTDPKLSKYYSPANEWFAMRKVDEYIKGGLKKQYEGETSPTPYAGNVFSILQDAVKKVMPDVTVEIGESGNPFFIRKNKSESVDPNKVYAAVNGMIDGNVLKQIEINGQYSLRNHSASDLLSIAKDTRDNQLANLNAQAKYYENQLATEPVATIKNEYVKALADVQNSINQVTNGYNEKALVDLTKTPEGLDQLRTTIYSHRLIDDVVKAGSYRKNDASLIVDQQKIWERKEAMSKLAADVKAKKSKNNSTDEENAGSGFDNVANNTQTDLEPITLDKFTEKKDNVIKDRTDILRKFFNNLGITQSMYADILDVKTQTSSNTGNRRFETYAQLLDFVAAKDGNAATLTLDDLSLVTQDKNITDKQREFFTKITTNFDLASKGQIDKVNFDGMRISKNEFLNTHEKYQDLTMEATTYDKLKIKAKESILSYITDPADKKYYSDYINGRIPNPAQNKNQYIDPSLIGGKKATPPKPGSIKSNLIVSPQINRILSKYKIDESAVIAKELEKAEYRENYLSYNLKGKKSLVDMGVELGSKITSSANAPEDIGESADITPLSVNRLPGKEEKWILNYEYTTKNGKKGVKNTPQEAIELSTDELKKLGINPLVKPELERYMRYNTTSLPYYTYIPEMKEAGVFKYDVVNLNQGLNNPQYVLRIYGEDGEIPLKIGFNNEPFRTANDAVLFAKTILSSGYLSKHNFNRNNFLAMLDAGAYK